MMKMERGKMRVDIWRVKAKMRMQMAASADRVNNLLWRMVSMVDYANLIII